MADEQVDEAGLRRLVRYLLAAGVHGVFANGSMGIFALLTDDQQLRAIEVVVDEVAGRVPVVAGISDTGTRRVIEKARRVQRLGVDFLTALPPFYFSLTDRSATRFFSEVAAAVEKPLLLYNNPTLGRVDLSLTVLSQLADEPNIVGLKESNPDCRRWRELVRQLHGRGDFQVLIGTEVLAPTAVMLGADGVIGGSHNLAPRIALDVYEAAMAGEHARAMESNERLVRLNSIFQFGEIWGAFEVALQFLEIGDKAAASPYASVTDEERLRIIQVLRDAGLAPWRDARPLAS